MFSQKEWLVVCLVLTGAFFAAINVTGQRESMIADRWYYTDFLFMVAPLVVLAFSSVLVFRYKTVGSHAVAWILFLAATASWLVADQIYSYDNEYEQYQLDAYLPDALYIAGYLLYFAFTLFYLKPRKAKITKNIIVLAVAISASFVIPSIYFVHNKIAVEDTETMVNSIYPILDGLVLAPTIIAIILFFRGQVNFLWVTILVAFIFSAAGDTMYLVESYNDEFGPGSVADMFFVWSYVFFAFGVYSHIKLFGRSRDVAA